MARIETEWRLLRKNPVTGVELWWRWNGDGTCTIRECQDVEPILDQNQALRNHDSGWDAKKEMRRAASIPNVVLSDFRRRGINLLKPEFQDELKKVLNDSDYSKLRTADWRV